ncbi:MAG: hypothetical protein QMC37_05380, partial [Flavobacteriales bacterium]
MVAAALEIEGQDGMWRLGKHTRQDFRLGPLPRRKFRGVQKGLVEMEKVSRQNRIFAADEQYSILFGERRHSLSRLHLN